MKSRENVMRQIGVPLAVRTLDPTLQVSEARKIMGNISPSKFYELVADGCFISYKIGARRMVDTASLLAYLEKLKHEAQPRDPRIALMTQARVAKKAERKSERPRLNK
jgi:hypothetical protein